MRLQELGAILRNNPKRAAEIRKMGLLETAAYRFGVVQHELYESGMSSTTDVQKAIRAHVMTADAAGDLTLVQRDHLFQVAHDSAGVRQFED